MAFDLVVIFRFFVFFFFCCILQDIYIGLILLSNEHDGSEQTMKFQPGFCAKSKQWMSIFHLFRLVKDGNFLSVVKSIDAGISCSFYFAFNYIVGR